MNFREERAVIYRRIVEDFVHAIRTQAPPKVSGEDGLRAIKLIEQGYQSSAQQQVVKWY